MTLRQQMLTIAVVVLGTMLTRFLPFVFFPEGKKPPRIVQYLGEVLPFASVGLLVVYCLKDAVFTALHGLPELCAMALVAGLQAWKRNMLLSMALGTLFYMILVQFVFI